MTTVTDPMHYLRKERNFLLARTERDGKGLPDRTFTEAELTYRQELRDLTNGVTTVEQANAVVFPTKP